MIELGTTKHRSVNAHSEQLNDGEVLYACPACGVVVSNHDPAAMRLHHLHVANAVHVDRTADAFRDRMQAERAQNDLHKKRNALLAHAEFVLAKR